MVMMSDWGGTNGAYTPRCQSMRFAIEMVWACTSREEKTEKVFDMRANDERVFNSSRVIDSTSFIIREIYKTLCSTPLAPSIQGMPVDRTMIKPNWRTESFEWHGVALSSGETQKHLSKTHQFQIHSRYVYLPVLAHFLHFTDFHSFFCVLFCVAARALDVPIDKRFADDILMLNDDEIIHISFGFHF